MASITLGSLAFADHAPLPTRYTADGEGLSPPLQWTGVPAGTASLVLLVEDADSPTPNPLVHAIVVGLPPEDGALAEAAMPSAEHEGVGLHRRAQLLHAVGYGCRPTRRRAMACIAMPSRSTPCARVPSSRTAPAATK